MNPRGLATEMTDQASVKKTPLVLDVAVACLLMGVTLASVLATAPMANAPMNDDFSYTFAARRLAETGRVSYNGWGSPILLPQMLYGAAIVRLFGPSNNALAASGIVVAALVPGLMYALARACRCRVVPAALATAGLMLNPIAISIAPSFMTDLPSLLLLLAALWALVRSMRKTAGSAITLQPGWLFASALLGFIAGSNRQVSWPCYLAALGVVGLLVPRNRGLVVTAGLIVLAGAIPLTLWFDRQPYIFPMHLSEGLKKFATKPGLSFTNSFNFACIWGVLLLPMALGAFRPGLWRRPMLWAILAVFLALALRPTASPPSILKCPWFGLPYLQSQYFTSIGVMAGPMDGRPAVGSQIPTEGVGLPRLAVIALDLAGPIGLGLGLATLLGLAKRLSRWRTRSIGLIASLALLSTTVVQIPLLIPWFGHQNIFDRYFLLLLPGPLIFLASRWRGRRAAVVLAGSMVAALTLWGLGIVFAADFGSYTRARASAFQAILGRGLDRRQIDAGFEFNAETQLLAEGSMNHSWLTNPPYRPEASGRYLLSFASYVPAMDASYFISPSPDPDGRASPREPLVEIPYSSLLPPHRRALFVYRIGRP